MSLRSLKIQWVTPEDGKVLEPYIQKLRERNMVDTAGPVSAFLADGLEMPRLEHRGDDGIRRRVDGMKNCIELLQELLEK